MFGSGTASEATRFHLTCRSIIEQLGPGAMDKVNADAFAEAYKDLVNLYNGKPVD
jgi:hypothetical protein